jgi:hypothetical protein
VTGHRVELLTFSDGQLAAILMFRPWGGPRADHSFVVALADREDLPAFLAIQKADISEVLVVPLNGAAEAILPPEQCGVFNRLRWTAFLWHLRGERMPADVLCSLVFPEAPRASDSPRQSAAKLGGTQ